MSVTELPPETSTHPSLAPVIRVALDALRRQIRAYVWTQGLAAAAVWLGVSMGVVLLADWWLEPPAGVRAGLLAAVAAAVAWAFYRMVLRRLLVRISDANLAMLIERRYPRFQETLLTTVELAQRAEPNGWNPRLFSETCRLAVQRMEGVDVRQVFDPLPLLARVGGAGGLALLAVFLLLAAPGEMRVFGRRMFLFSDELWPRRTHLSVVGFESGSVKVARGTDFELVARAEAGHGRVVPKVVHVRYREGGVGRDTMTRTGTADPRKDAYQEYAYTFRNLAADAAFDVVGGDDAVRNLRIEVVDSPTIEMTLRYQLPSYMDLPGRELPASGTMQLPQGTRLVLAATANKDLVRVQVEAAGEEPSAGRMIEMAADDRRHFQYTVPQLDKDTTLLFTLWDTDGIRNREPVRLTLAAVPDEPPRLAALLQGVGTAITPRARLPVSGQVTDDYGLARVWFEHSVDPQPAAVKPIAAPQPHTTSYDLNTVFDVEPLGLTPGKKLLLCVKAADHRDIGGGPNVGSSERWVREIVTPEQLRAILEARELVLRQRFEAILREVGETRDLLSRLDSGGAPNGNGDDPPAAGDKPGPAKAAAAGEMAAPKPAEPEPGDDDEKGPPTPERAKALRALRVDRAVQNGRKNAQEVLGVAEAFEEIRQELVNNRIDTEELILRVKGGIADPLRRVGNEMFPELDRRLDRLRLVLGDPQAALPARNASRQQVDAILVAMRQVLDRMLELENFNEAVELLRSIVQMQEKLNDQTKQQHKQKLRDLLGE